MKWSLLPSPARRWGGRLRAERVRSQVCAELHSIARSGKPVVAGPWLGEVGFEILYWLPFLRWAFAEFGIEQSRVTALSRGGAGPWYSDIAAGYIDMLDRLGVDDYRAGNASRIREVGQQKQVQPSAFEQHIVESLRREQHLRDTVALHPSLMYRLLQPFWWKHADEQWVSRHTTPRLMAPLLLPSGLAVQPGHYVAAKFYRNDCLSTQPTTRTFVADAISRLAQSIPVVSLDTGLALDDHPSAEGADGPVHSIAALVTPATNLSVQTAVLANARGFVGTYGGFSYLPPMLGVPTLALFDQVAGFDRSHLQIAQQTFARVGAARFDIQDLNDTTPTEVAARVAGPS